VSGITWSALVGLGLALAQPSRPVVVVTGDGEQIMGTGALMTVAVVLDPARPGDPIEPDAEARMAELHAGLAVMPVVEDALAQPSRPVVVVTGDGEQIMGTGALMTVAVAAP
jgi:thiamine pyrophosphate-dependent acetolactate synthase large subunit-like protein